MRLRPVKEQWDVENRFLLHHFDFGCGALEMLTQLDELSLLKFFPFQC